MDEDNCSSSSHYMSSTSLSELERSDKDEVRGQNTSGITSQHDTEEGPHLDTPIPRGNERKRKGENMVDALNAFMDL
ncbi:hypothetical protein R3I93_000433 [Phoxinus phoxinus]|uniref:Uncharacterized protein n=1 Tax=Phoxinus phoxinus TaxID=58324 RepID=A0AAN9HI03_9TELE